MKQVLFKVGLAIVFAWFIFGGVYTAATGDVLWSNIHYQTAGRIVAAISVVVALGFSISTIRMERRWKREREARRPRPPHEAIPYRCPARDHGAQCIEPEGHEGPHDFRYDYEEPEAHA